MHEIRCPNLDEVRNQFRRHTQPSINSMAKLNYSEQMLVDCDPYNNACRGGDYTGAWQYIQEVGGAMRSANYPYVSRTTLTVSLFSNL